MKRRSTNYLPAIVFAASAGLLPCSIRSVAADGAESGWVHTDADGKLRYKTTERGDSIQDFSYAGYGGGGVAIPTAPTKRTVSPSGADDTAAIQAAIDAVSTLEPVDGLRGAVLLAPGKFTCTAALTIKASGVVLRGSGSGADGTTIRMTGSPHVCVALAGDGRATATETSSPITDAYVPSGAASFHVGDGSRFKAGDTIAVRRPVTPAWVQFMGMDTLVRNGKKQTWLSGETRAEYVVKGVADNEITLAVPLSDSLDARYLSPPGASIIKVTPSRRIENVGVEDLHIVSPAQAIGIDEPQNQAVKMNGVTDAFLRNLASDDTVNSIQIGADSSRITVEEVDIRHTVATKGAAKPADFTAGGTQILFDRCTDNGDNLFYFVTGARAAGPNVLLHCVFHGHGWIQPHARWATGLLVDSCDVPDGGIDFMNRGIMGSGHGWTVGWAVAYNCTAHELTIQNPPGVINWAIGCVGQRLTIPMPGGSKDKMPEGTFDSDGAHVAPASLYLAQLRERLGASAVTNIGY